MQDTNHMPPPLNLKAAEGGVCLLATIMLTKYKVTHTFEHVPNLEFELCCIQQKFEHL
jgi:hypothetical protein